jgi:hypothetical protein
VIARFGVFLGIVFFCLLLGGCASIYSVVEFEVLEPATVRFPEQVQQLIILNRAPLTPDVWDEVNQEELDARQLVLLDTLINNNLDRGILEVLRNSPIQRFQYPIWLSDRRTDTIALENRMLTRREVDNICDTIGGDAIISMEYYVVGLLEHYEYFRDNPTEIQNRYFEVHNKIKWNIHLPGRPTPFDSYVTADTLYYPSIENGTWVGTYVSGPDMIRDLFYESGYRYGMYLVPVWITTTRYLYRGKEDALKMAIRRTDAGDWETAYSIWEEMSESPDSVAAAKAVYNLAIYYELEDQLDTASIMVDRALELDSLELARNYREELDVRLLNRKELESQVF